jgi:hypothetical protein
VFGRRGCTDCSAVINTFIFQCVEKLMRPAPFAEASLEIASLMKSMSVFCAEAGGVAAGDPSDVPGVAASSVAPAPLAEDAALSVLESVAEAEEVLSEAGPDVGVEAFAEVVPDVPVEDAGAEPVADAAGVLASPAEVPAGACAEDVDVLAPIAPYTAAIFRE